MDEIIVSGYCRVIDGNRILCAEYAVEAYETDCLYPDCDFANSCRLIEALNEKVKKAAH